MSTEGRKKLKQAEAEINRLSNVVHPNLLRVLAVKLSMPHGDGNSPDSGKLVVLSEERPRLSLEDVLEDSESLREGRAKVRPKFTPRSSIINGLAIDLLESMSIGAVCNSRS